MEGELSPLVTVVPSAGSHPHADTTPRARAALRLSSSEASKLKSVLRPLPTVTHARHNSTDAVLMRSRAPLTSDIAGIRKQTSVPASVKAERVSALPSLAPVCKDTVSVESSDAKSEQSNEDECASDITEDDSDFNDDSVSYF